MVKVCQACRPFLFYLTLENGMNCFHPTGSTTSCQRRSYWFPSDEAERIQCIQHSLQCQLGRSSCLKYIDSTLIYCNVMMMQQIFWFLNFCLASAGDCVQFLLKSSFVSCSVYVYTEHACNNAAPDIADGKQPIMDDCVSLSTEHGDDNRGTFAKEACET